MGATSEDTSCFYQWLVAAAFGPMANVCPEVFAVRTHQPRHYV